MASAGHTIGLCCNLGPFKLGIVNGAVVGGIVYKSAAIAAFITANPITIGFAVVAGIAIFVGKLGYDHYKKGQERKKTIWDRLDENDSKELLEMFVEIKKMLVAERGPALGIVKQLCEQKEIPELYDMFVKWLETEFRCQKCNKAPLQLIDICLCQTIDSPNEVNKWTCHCISDRRACCPSAE